MIARSVALLVLLLSFTRPAPAEEVRERPETRAAMGQMAQALAVAYGDALDPDIWSSPDHRARILEALGTLMEGADQLARHGDAELDPGTRPLREALLRDTAEAALRFQEGHLERSRFKVQQLTSTCFACHARLPAPAGSALGAAITARATGLSKERRAHLAVATRQFEEGLGLWEDVFIDPTELPADELDRPLEDHVEVAIRAVGDVPRALAAVDMVLARPDLPRRHRRGLTVWATDLARLQGETAGDPLERGRAWLERGRSLERHAFPRAGFVAFVAAARQLQRHVDTHVGEPATLAEAYLLLGRSSTFIPRSFWVSEADGYFESAIRVDPSSPHAREAYEALQAWLSLGWSGSEGLELPKDQRHRLAELRGLLQAAR